MKRIKDLSGQKFNKLTVLELDKIKTDRVYYKCLCDCGNVKTILAQNFVNGKAKSCGCLRIANITSKKRTDPIRVTARRIWLARYSDGCSFETFFKLAQLNCYYCGSPPSNYSNLYTGKHPVLKRSPDWAAQCHWTYNGLDRIDSAKQHSEDNIVPCCAKCNWAKNKLSLTDFKLLIEKIYTHFVLGKKDEIISSTVSGDKIS